MFQTKVLAASHKHIKLCRYRLICLYTSTRDGSSSGLGDMDLAGAAAVGGGGDDVLRGGRLTGGLLVQVFRLVLGCALRGRLLRLQLALTLGDDVVGLEAQEGST